MTIDLTQPNAPTLYSVRQLLASASDKTHTQLRVTKSGIAFIWTDRFGSDDTDVAFRIELWSAGTDHVGPKAANDVSWVARIHKVLRENWPIPSDNCIDSY